MAVTSDITTDAVSYTVRTSHASLRTRRGNTKDSAMVTFYGTENGGKNSTEWRRREYMGLLLHAATEKLLSCG